MICHVSQAQQPCRNADSRAFHLPISLGSLRFSVAFVIFGLFSAESLPAKGAGAGAIADAWSVCPRHISAAEARHGLPPHLLTAISKVESGRWHPEKKENLAWPWTVMAEGKGRYLPSKAAAVAEVRALRAKGVRNIDVGCMQVNLHYHPKAFASLEEAFDPARNTSYAASLLEGHRRNAGSWTRAIGDYHSKTIAFARAYRLKVFKAWRAERHAENRRLREARIAQHEQRKAELRESLKMQANREATLRLDAGKNGSAASAGIWR